MALEDPCVAKCLFPREKHVLAGLWSSGDEIYEKSLHQPSELLILDSPKHEDSGHLLNFALRTLNAIKKSGKPRLRIFFLNLFV